MERAFRPVIIENVYPELDCGRHPVKREIGDRFEVWADPFKEGHDKLAEGRGLVVGTWVRLNRRSNPAGTFRLRRWG